ncbi:hypothetical protein [Fischerella thermalis]|uniref:Uncharacterized protein n=2 Tax=Fischerella thermalis TaxID=372787 RepID=A0A2N6LE94_9CYAN|nr:hypothetical protein [Fischerella thermalis]PMB21563.1 hypothetical protein CEN46_14160 [Fischerella thermalis CCMEE 5318]PMB28085.1 hypothetical protein CEN47_14450 [Fischerella thermalis CCMEE 5319]
MTQDYTTKWWAAFSCLAFIEGVLLVMLFSGRSSVLTIAALLFIAILMVFLPRADDVVALTFDRDKIDNKINSLNKKLSTTKNRADKIFLLTIPESMYKTLQKINSGNYGNYDLTAKLERELYHLRDIGYIEDTKEIRDIPYEGNNLSNYVKITALGKQYIELRKSIEEENKGKDK